jgi:predicted glycosyltransferase
LKSAGVNVAEHPAPEVPRLAAPLLTAPELSVKVAVAPAGYNLTYELLALGVWHLALPAARQFDDQWLRATRLATVVRSPEAAERRVWAWLSQRAPRPPSQIRCMKDLAQVLCARGAGAAASR